MRRLRTAAALSVLVSATELSRVSLMRTEQPQQDALVLLTPNEIKWTPGSRPDIANAPLWGDRTKGPYGRFSRYDSGVHLALHYHTNELRGLIMSGTWVLQVAGGAAKELPAGSYFDVPGKTQHTDTCKTGPCIVYLSNDAAPDLVYVTPGHHVH
jgi:hypothetical protein